MSPAGRHPIAVVTAMVALVSFPLTAIDEVWPAELYVGGASASITPDKPVALAGQFHTRIAREVDNPVMATALALESRHGDRAVDQAVMVSCDLAVIPRAVQRRLRERLVPVIPDLDVRKLFVSATHTHTAPVMEEGAYVIEDPDVLRPSEYVDFLLDRLADLVIVAWQSREPGGVSWVLGHAVVGHNRRTVYADGTAQMYGPADEPHFRSFEGYEDHAVKMLFFWDTDENPLAVAVNLACPSQEVESLTRVNADFWHDVRHELRKRHGDDFHVLGWTAPSGDLSPHLQYRNRAEDRMRGLRGLSRTQEIARRIVAAVDDVYPFAKSEIATDVPFIHHVEDMRLPLRTLTEEELTAVKQRCEAIQNKPNRNPADQRRLLWHRAVIKRYESQHNDPYYDMELHVVRFGDVVIATNPFELFLDFGVRIEARSPAVQTFLIQLTGAYGGYLATEKAVKGGGYSAVVESTVVGPEGGQIFVDCTVDAIRAMWTTKHRLPADGLRRR